MTDEQPPVPTVEELNALGKGFLFDALGMRIEEASAERVVMSMPVTQMTQQPVGILHGGATVALAESAASIGTWLGHRQDGVFHGGARDQLQSLCARSATGRCGPSPRRCIVADATGSGIFACMTRPTP